MTDSLDIMLRILLGADTVRNFENGTISIEDALKGVDQEALDLADTFANALDNSLKELDKQFANTKKSIEGMKQSAEKVGQISQAMFVAGSAIVGGMYLAAKTEADRVVEAGGQVDGVTARWIAANERIEASQQKIGRAAEVAVLPLMEQAASLAEKAADFVEKHPDLVSAALKIGVVTASIGAIGSVAAKGIRLFADAKYLLASAQMTINAAAMNTAAATMFEAAMLMQGGGAGKVVGGLGSAARSILPIGEATTATVATGALAMIGTVLGGILAGGMITDQINKKGIEAGTSDTAWETTRKTALVLSPLHLISAGLENVGLMSTETEAKIWDFQKSILGLGTATEDAASKESKAAEEAERVAKAAEEAAKAQEAETKAKEEATKAAEKRAQAEKQLAEAYENFTQQETEAAAQYASSKRKITVDANRAELDATRTHEQSIVNIESDYVKQRADLLNDYKSEDAQAASKYQQERAQAVRDGGIEIQKIEQDHQKRLAELLDGHNERMSDLIANRDALGLAKENQAYEKSRREEESKTNEEIGQRRADLALKLQDMAQGYAAERAQRAQALQQALVDAAEQHKAQIAEEQAKFTEDARQRKEQTARQLNDLATQFREESVRRRNAFLQSIRDLDSALNGETNRKREYYALMLKDANAFMAQWRSQMYPSTTKTTTPIHDYSGYAYTGTYAMAQDGQREFVLSGAATKAAEQMVGGQLNQQALLSGLAGQGGAGMQYVDQSTYSGMTVADVRRVRQIGRQEAIAVMIEAGRK